MRRQFVLAAGAVALAVAASGCGSGSSGASTSHGDVLGVIKAAASTTAQQKSVAVRGSTTMDLGAVTGASTGSVSASFTGLMRTDPVAGRMTMSGLSIGGQSVGDVTVLLTPNAFFMRLPMLSAQTGKPWAEIKFSEMKSHGFDFKQFMSQAEQMQPAQYISQLTASGDVHVVGKQTVNGVQTTHYAGTVSLADELSHYSADVRAQLEPVMKRAGFTGSQIDIWLDGKGLVRRARTTTQGGKGSMTFSMDITRYGVPVDVTPPPPSQVADLAQLAAAGSGAAGQPTS